MHSKDLASYIVSKPRYAALEKLVSNNERSIFLSGLRGSASAAFIAPLINSKNIKSDNKYIFILNDIEDAGYFYHDLIQIAGNENILFFPSSYKRAIKYGQIDSASEILRTEALNRLKQPKPIMLVTYPEAIAEKVVSKELLTERTLQIRKGENYDLSFIGEIGRAHV